MTSNSPENLIAISGSLQIPARLPNRLENVHVPCAAAGIAGDGFANFLFGWLGVLGEQLMSRKHQTGRAEATLQAVRIAEGLLNGMKLSVFFEALDGGDLRPVSLHREDRAGLYGHAVHQHGAGTAVRGVATDMRAR